MTTDACSVVIVDPWYQPVVAVDPSSGVRCEPVFIGTHGIDLRDRVHCGECGEIVKLVL